MQHRLISPRFCAVAGAALALFPLGSCKSGTQPAATATGIELILMASSIPEGGTEPASATETFSDGSTQDVTQDVTWGTSDEYIADVTCESGICSVNTSNEGQTTLSATFNNLTGTSAVTVTAPALASIECGIGSPSLAKGQTTVVSCTATFSDMSMYDVTEQSTWTTSDPTVATVSCTPPGQDGGMGICIVSTIGIGMATLTGTVNPGNFTSPVTVQVTAPIIASLAISPTPVSIASGLSQQLMVTATLTDGSTEDATSICIYGTSNNNIAMVTAAGLVTGGQPGETFVSASNGDTLASAPLTVSQPVLESVTISPSMPALTTGQTATLTTKGLYSDSSTQDLSMQTSWSTSNSGVATISNATASQGLLMAVEAGTSTIIATIAGSTVTGTTTVSVTPPIQPTSITVSATTQTVPAGGTDQMKATALFAGAPSSDVTDQATWNSGTPGVATISTTGLVTSVATGTTLITATFGTLTNTFSLTVTPAQPVSLQFAAVSTIHAGDLPVALDVSEVYTDGTSQDVTSSITSWMANPPGIATISSGLLTPLAQGTTTVSATAPDGTTGSTMLTIGPALTTVVVTPGSLTVTGGAKLLTATGFYGASSTVTITEHVNWSTSDPNDVNLTAIQSMPGSVLVSCNNPTTGAVTVTATVLLAGNQPVTGTASVTCE